MSTPLTPPRNPWISRSLTADAVRRSLNLAARTLIVVNPPRLNRTVILSRWALRRDASATEGGLQSSIAPYAYCRVRGEPAANQRLERYSTGTGSIESAKSKPNTWE